MVGFWENGRNVTNFKKNYVFIYTFFGTHLQVRPVDGFSRLWLKRRGLAQGCAFWGFVDIVAHFGSEIPPNPPILGVRIGVFKPSVQNIESFISSKLLRRFQASFAQR